VSVGLDQVSQWHDAQGQLLTELYVSYITKLMFRVMETAV